MKCPKCGGEVKLLESINTPSNEIYRKRKCKDCKKIFYTIEFEVEDNKRFMDEYEVYDGDFDDDDELSSDIDAMLDLEPEVNELDDYDEE